MSISNELMYAILSMDAYNREYGAGIKISGNSIGTADIINRTTVGIGQEQYQAWQDVDFYAAAYSYNGQTVISYRGTDDPLPDVNYGYSLGMGLPGAAQD
ncbi:MAG: hypothetical protein GY743_21575, partial [Planctomycetaceae bacterium]|nr:hypothetical protein [Planctomycetaceae bacterium]